MDVLHYYEINSTYLFDNKTVIYKVPTNFIKNINFDNNLLNNYLYYQNYPILKNKKIIFTQYDNNELPNDFDFNEYNKLNTDLPFNDENNLKNHFINSGINEGRLYKKNQQIKRPEYLQKYIDNLQLNFDI